MALYGTLRFGDNKEYTLHVIARQYLSDLTIQLCKRVDTFEAQTAWMNGYRFMDSKKVMVNPKFLDIREGNIDGYTLDVFKVKQSSIQMYWGKSVWTDYFKQLKLRMDALGYKDIVIEEGKRKVYEHKENSYFISLTRDKTDLVGLTYSCDTFSIELDYTVDNLDVYNAKLKHSLQCKEKVMTEKEVTGLMQQMCDPLNVCKSIEDIAANKNIEYEDMDKWYFVEDYDLLFEKLEELRNTEALIGYDVETTGIEMNSISRDYHDFIHTNEDCDVLVGFVWGLWGTKERYYIPLRHTHYSFKPLFIDFGEYYDKIYADVDTFHYSQDLKDRIHMYMEDMKAGKDVKSVPYYGDYILMGYMKPILEKKNICAANASFEWKVNWIYWINTKTTQDPLAQSYLVKATLKYLEHSLKYLSFVELGIESVELDDFSPTSKWGDLGINFGQLDKPRVRVYVFNDITTMFKLLEYYSKEIIESKQQYIYSLEVLFSRAVGYSEFWGYRIDKADLKPMEDKLNQAIQMKSKIFFDTLNVEPFNLASPKVLVECLKTHGFPELIDTKEESLKEYKSHEIIELLLDIRSMQTDLKNFVAKLPKFIREDGRVYSSVLAQGARTGRLTASKPNYMQANDTAKGFTKADDDFYFIDSDLNQIEYRETARLSGQKNLIEMFENPENDYHTYQTARMRKIPYELVPKHLRDLTKTINFGLPYGMGDSTLGMNLYGARNAETKAKAKRDRALYFEGQEDVLRFFETTKKDAVKYGYTTTADGRRRYYDFDKYPKWKIEKQAGNARIQGSALDRFKAIMVQIFMTITKYDLLDLFRMNCFIHDEGLFEVHKSINPYFALKLVRCCFENTNPCAVKIMSGAGIGYTWGQAKSGKREIGYVLGRKLFEKADTIWWKDSKYYRDDKNYEEIMLEEIYNHETGILHEYFTNPENEGKVIRPYLYKLLMDKYVTKEMKANKGITLMECVSYFLKNYFNTEPTVTIKTASEVAVNAKPETPVDVPIEIDPVVSVDSVDFLKQFGYYFDSDSYELYMNITGFSKEQIIALKTNLENYRVGEDPCKVVLYVDDNGTPRFKYTSYVVDWEFTSRLIKSRI